MECLTFFCFWRIKSGIKKDVKIIFAFIFCVSTAHITEHAHTSIGPLEVSPYDPVFRDHISELFHYMKCQGGVTRVDPAWVFICSDRHRKGFLSCIERTHRTVSLC